MMNTDAYNPRMDDVAFAITMDDRELLSTKLDESFHHINKCASAWLAKAWAASSLSEAEDSIHKALEFEPENQIALAGLTWIHGIRESAVLQQELKREVEDRQKAEEEARLKAEEEARLKAEEEARLKAEEEARLKAEEEARLKAEEEARLQAEEEARQRAEEEMAAQKAAEEDASRALNAEQEAEAQQTAIEEEARLEEEAQRKAEAFRRAEEQRQREEREAVAERLQAEKEARLAEEARRAEEEMRRIEEEARVRAEAELEAAVGADPESNPDVSPLGHAEITTEAEVPAKAEVPAESESAVEAGNEFDFQAEVKAEAESNQPQESDSESVLPAMTFQPIAPSAETEKEDLETDPKPRIELKGLKFEPANRSRQPAPPTDELTSTDTEPLSVEAIESGLKMDFDALAASVRECVGVKGPDEEMEANDQTPTESNSAAVEDATTPADVAPPNLDTPEEFKTTDQDLGATLGESVEEEASLAPAPELETDREAKLEQSEPSTFQSKPSDRCFEPATVLVVDDSPTILRLVSMTLSGEEFNVVTADSESEAQDILKNQCPDLIVADFHLPKMGSHKLSRSVKKLESTKEIPVLMLTEKDSVVEKVRGKMSGCSSYMAKPFDAEQLLSTVRQHLNRAVTQS